MSKSFYKEVTSPITGVTTRFDLGKQYQLATGDDLISLPLSRNK
ncbi:MAG: hypothetical protein WC851_02655 [Candidatus Shapirobacteria bacterium]|jgi:hypothetical protein